MVTYSSCGIIGKKRVRIRILSQILTDASSWKEGRKEGISIPWTDLLQNFSGWPCFFGIYRPIWSFTRVRQRVSNKCIADVFFSFLFTQDSLQTILGFILSE